MITETDFCCWHGNIFTLACSAQAFVFLPRFHAICVCARVCCIILYADGCCWLRYGLMTHSLFNLLEVLQSRRQSLPVRPTPERLPFHTSGAVLVLIETHFAATAFSQRGKWQVKFAGHFLAYLCPPRSAGQSGCEVPLGTWSQASQDTGLYRGASKSWRHSWAHVCQDACLFI